jgi:hypothetical protein
MRHHEPESIKKWLAKLTREKCYPFPDVREPLEATTEKGVYIIYSPQGRVAHVGSTPRAKGGVAQRLRDHLAGRSSFVQKQLKGDGSRLRKRYKFRYLVIGKGRDRALVEALGIGRLCPEHIGHGLDTSSK